MTDPARVRRHAERIRELVATVVRTQIKDPRLGMITITDARITADLRDATVFYTVLGDAAAKTGTAAALESAKGLLRSTVGKALGLRYTPTLSFVLVATQIGQHLHVLSAATGAALIAAAVLSVLVYPLVALSLLHETASDGSEPALSA